MISTTPKPDSRCWTDWPIQHQLEAIEHFKSNRKRQSRLTISLRFHGTTGRKIQNLVWAHKHNQNLVSGMLEQLRERPEKYRDDGALECIREMLLQRAEAIEAGRTPGKPLIMLANVIAERFSEADDIPPKNNDEQEATTASPRRPPRVSLDARDYPIIWTLRKGAYGAAALPLLRFYIDIQQYAQKYKTPAQSTMDAAITHHETERADTDDADMLEEENLMEVEGRGIAGKKVEQRYPQTVADVPDIPDLHRIWADCWARYKQAARRKIPRGRDRGKLFGEALVARRVRYGRHRGRIIRRPGKHRVRWLRENLFSVEQVTQALTAVYILLHREDHNDDAIAKAESAEHLWRRDEHYERRPRASHIDRRRSNSRRAPTQLKALSADELLAYEAELLEMLDHAVQFAEVAEDIEVFLSESPPSYPTIEQALFDKTHAHLYNGYRNSDTPMGR